MRKNYPVGRIGSLEYAALRATIATRGGLRLSLALAGFTAWGVVLATVLIGLPNPVAASIPLLLLVVTFEINRVLHLGVERIGRYLQVFYEEGDPEAPSSPWRAPAWERSAIHQAPAVPGAGGHPLLVPLFLMATALNLLAVLLPDPLPLEAVTLGIPHAAWVVWMLRCDRAMRRQRARDLNEFRAFRDTGSAAGAAS